MLGGPPCLEPPGTVVRLSMASQAARATLPRQMTVSGEVPRNESDPPGREPATAPSGGNMTCSTSMCPAAQRLVRGPAVLLALLGTTPGAAVAQVPAEYQ